MATKYITIECIAEWAKVFEHNRDLHGYKNAWDDTEGRTTINLIMSNDDFDKLKKAGSLKRGTPDAQGRGVNVKVDRKWKTGRDWEDGAPEVLRPDGNPWNPKVDGEIGNGSKVRVQVSVAVLDATAITRLEKIKVLELVEYEGRDSDFYKDETGGTPTPKPEAKAPAKDPAPAGADLDDEIPF